MSWRSVDGGETVGRSGYSGGTILRDELFDESARITLEEGSGVFTISVAVSGWFDHVREYPSRKEARDAYDQMKLALEDIVRRIPFTDDPEADGRMDEVSGAVRAFLEEFA